MDADCFMTSSTEHPIAPDSAPYVLADLPYAYDALAPVIIPAIMELHHGTHHRSYVTNANTLLAKLDALPEGDDPSTLLRALSFNVSGHVMHELFWASMTPGGGGQPGPQMRVELERAFGSVDRAKALLTASVAKLAGSGWGVLSWETSANRLMVSQVHDHQHDALVGSVPIMCIDGWEHAYYLQYQANRAAWANAFWDIVDWESAENRLAEAVAW
jgi:superoxide dismutase, Fe-Mn family